ncbi:MAG: pilus assembly protein TadG-related protein [Sphingomicrobium sp.]
MQLSRSSEGAVAPTIALSLFALIAAGGIAFDYARMATLDSELQSAADQAALAAASQLDGEDGACLRAAAAAKNMLLNKTLLANDTTATAITIADEPDCDSTGMIRFWKDIEKTDPADSDADAKFVEVQVDPRTAIFALTPVVGAMSSGALNATAFAGMGEAYCKTPPVMICNPQETSTDTDFDPSALIGKGLRLVSVGGGTGGWAPGNFGYLDTGGGSNGAPGLREALGWGNPPGDCITADGVDTKPGATVTVTDSINTRFDVYDGNSSCPTGGSCPSSINSLKDVRRPANANGGNKCKMHNAGWQLPANYYGQGTVPSSATAAMADTVIPDAMGHPRDMCHAAPTTATGACIGPIGTGNWDRDAYFRTNYRRGNATRWSSSEWKTNTGLTSTATRYQVYLWEIEHIGDSIDGVTVLGPSPPGATGAALVGYGSPVCSPTEGYGAGTVPDDENPDRRKITVAVANCLDESVNGSSNDIAVKDWLEVFMVEPSLNRSRTNAGDVYVEVIGTLVNPTDEGSVQLVHKSVPYLIE